MALEVIRYLIEGGKEKEFEADYVQAAKILDDSPYCEGYELSRSKKESNRYLLLINWQSMDAHLQGFRQSTEFGEFFRLVKPYYNMLEEMEHYERTIVYSQKAAN